MDTQKIILERPIAFGVETVTCLNFREPKAGDMRNIKSVDQYGVVMDIATRLCDRGELIDMLEAPDVDQVFNLVTGFLPKCLGIGRSV